MPWQYCQKTGELTDPHGKPFAVGYAGAHDGKNCPAMQAVHNVGPLPVGRYLVGAPMDHPHSVGLYALYLEPAPSNEMFGRSLFYIHGDNRAANGTASEGCIVLDFTARQAIWQSGDHHIEVISGLLETPKEST